MKTIAALFVAFTALGCSSSRGVEARPATVTRADAPRACPLGVEGASVTVEETPNGVALVFASKEATADLRERARDAAAMRGPGRKEGKGHDGRHGTGGEHGLQIMGVPPANATVDDVPDGARIHFVPADAADLATLRTKIRDRAARMSTAPCDR